MTAKSACLLKASNLSMERGGRELFVNLSFAVTDGEIVQIEGANGAGKTSLLRVLAGLARYGYGGSVQRSSSLMYLGHQPGVKALLSPRENLAWHVSGRGKHSKQEIDAALAAVGLYGYEDAPCNTLSAGQLRRVNLARLYLPAPTLWLLDEPFTAIDKTGVAELETRMGVHAKAGGAVVLTSHQRITMDHAVRSINLQEVGQG
ncbi:MAG: cytochrome c biogenesis heme-transporting ATPase CcmA [Pseudomonadota bacterium]